MQKSTILTTKMIRIRETIRIWHVTMIAMIATGLLYPMYDGFNVPKIMIGVFTYWGFIAWAVMMVLCGIGGILKPQYMVYWLSVFFPMLFALMIYAFQGFFIQMGWESVIYADKPSYTAIIYYSSLYLFTLYSHYREHGILNSIIESVPPLRIAGLINLLMALVLITNPDGAGMGLLYAKLETFTQGIVNPVMAYQLIYLVGGIILFIFPEVTQGIAQVLTAPMILHGMLFTIYIAFNNQAWAFVPFFLAVSMLWWHMGGRGYERA